MSKHFWCAAIILGWIFALSHAQTYEHFNFAVFNQVNTARRTVHRYRNYIRYDSNHRFLTNDETDNQMCLSANFNEESMNSCHYSVTTAGGREWYQATIDDLDEGVHSHHTHGLTWSNALSQQCYDLISQQGPAGHYGHIGEDGSTLRDRMNRYSDYWTAASQIVTYSDRYGRIASDLVKQLIIDDGIDNVSHRRTIYNPAWTHLGVSCGCHATYSMSCCLAFGIEVIDSPEYEQPQVADQVNTCQCTAETFGSTRQHHEAGDDTTHFDHRDNVLVHRSGHRGDLSEVSFDSGPAQAIFLNDPETDNLGNSTLTWFPTRGHQRRSDQPNPDTCLAINRNTTEDPFQVTGSLIDATNRMQLSQEGERPTLDLPAIERQMSEHAANLLNAEQSLGENVGNTTDTEDPGYTGLAVPATYENRARTRVFEELNRVRTDPQGYAEENFAEGDPEYDILMSHESCDEFEWNDNIMYSALGYVNQAGPWGSDNAGTTREGYTLVDYFLVNFNEFGYTTFGLLYGHYYLENPRNIVSAIISQMGEDYLFNCYYEQFGLGCSCSSEDTLTCAYAISAEDTPIEAPIEVEWLPTYGQSECHLLCTDDE